MRKVFWITTDPKLSGRRISVMQLCVVQPLQLGDAAPKLYRYSHIETYRVQEALNPATQWLQRVRDQRDKSAFQLLFHHFAPRLKTMLQRGGLPAAQAEELVQDVLLTVWRKSDLFDAERAEASAWIYGIARNRMIDHIRKSRRPLPEELLHQSELSENPSQVFALEEEVSHLRQAVAKLPDDQRRLIEHAYLGELSHAEIKDLTGLPLGTVKSRIRLGLDRLRHTLKELREK
jgi:RNA polymerase sigma-70 factor, ECF subfamily